MFVTRKFVTNMFREPCDFAWRVLDVSRGGRRPRFPGAIATARGAGIPIIYVTGSFRPGHPEISGRNIMFAAVAAAGRVVRGDPGTGICPAVAPAAGWCGARTPIGVDRS